MKNSQETADTQVSRQKQGFSTRPADTRDERKASELLHDNRRRAGNALRPIRQGTLARRRQVGQATLSPLSTFSFSLDTEGETLATGLLVSRG